VTVDSVTVHTQLVATGSRRAARAEGPSRVEVDAAPASTAFDEFFDRTHARLFAALCLTTGNSQEAEDIAQDAFVRVLERWNRVSEMDDPTGYLFTTAMNLFRKRYRRAQLAALLPMPAREAVDELVAIDDRDVVVRALRDLPPRQRAAVVLTTFLDLPSKEAARILGINDSTVRVLAGKARAELRASIVDDDR
jgi:RNA polymerase sigma factor (sigma-70 family)